ncbi:hypothetical protein [Vulgatibacter incomptus]|uniref:hypothetical protein n=1 Tax=Vulgatibacter incomptus TaxID=1391653 RepID=UPI0012F9FC3E|nr:hypothetical protein [Vulgatibacter incomptus]
MKLVVLAVCFVAAGAHATPPLPVTGCVEQDLSTEWESTRGKWGGVAVAQVVDDNGVPINNLAFNRFADERTSVGPHDRDPTFVGVPGGSLGFALHAWRLIYTVKTDSQAYPYKVISMSVANQSEIVLAEYSPTTELSAPSFHSGNAVWSANAKVKLYRFSNSTLTDFSVGTNPSIRSGLVAYELDGTIGFRSLLGLNGDFGSPEDGERFQTPNVGSDLVAYEKITSIGESLIAYRSVLDPTSEELVSGPCLSHHKPRLNATGRFVLYSGDSCPAEDGIDPIYLTDLVTGLTYLVASVDEVNRGNGVYSYDIDQDSFAYLETYDDHSDPLHPASKARIHHCKVALR